MHSDTRETTGVSSPPDDVVVLPVGEVWMGDLRRLEPISRDFGANRGQPIDRFYINRFFADHRSDFYGRILQIRDKAETAANQALNGDSRSIEITELPALMSGIEENFEQFNCIILEQSLTLIQEMQAAIQAFYDMLK